MHTNLNTNNTIPNIGKSTRTKQNATDTITASRSKVLTQAHPKFLNKNLKTL